MAGRFDGSGISVMGKPPAFQMYAADFDMDTNTWTNEEVGLYLRLLLSQWVNGPLVDDPVKLAKVGRISHKKFTNLFQNISHKFVRNGDGKLQNERLESEREKQRKYRESQSNAGKRGARKRWKTDSKPNGDPNGKPDGETIALQSSSSSSISKEKKELKKWWGNQFDVFWKEYPNKAGKKPARIKWNKIEKQSAELFRAIMDGLGRAKASEGWEKEDGQYIPHPTTWLNNDRWEDEIEGNITDFDPELAKRIEKDRIAMEAKFGKITKSFR